MKSILSKDGHKEGWRKVNGSAERMKVPNGWIYRIVVEVGAYEGKEGLIFVRDESC